MSPLQAKVMKAWIGADADHWYYSFAGVAAHSGVPRKHIRRTVRALARAGYLEFGKGLWNDEGEVAGAGYCLTDTGRKYLADIMKEKVG